MRRYILTLALIAAAATLAGCSSLKMGAACYMPYGVPGTCQVTTLAPADAR